MINLKKIFVIVSICFSYTVSNSQNIGSLLGNLVDGIFSSSDITIADLAGNYVAQGPAVTFKSDNFLKNAGGLAGAAALESKLEPYYQTYGLNGMTMEIDKDAKFKMKVKGITFSGNITKNEDGTFNFNITVLNKNIGSFKTYIEKSMNNMSVMFDAQKLTQLLSSITKVTGNSMASSLGSLLGSYEGTYIGFKMIKEGSSAPSNSSDSTGNKSVSSGVSNLLDLLKKK